jgi:predicted enzyme related to lactoylglutathione lyase
LPATDYERAKAFYERLGFIGKEETDGITYECAEGTGFMVFPSSGQASGTHTQLGIEVKDLDAEMTDLRSKGVTFEEYDFPGMKTENGMMSDPSGGKGAWFKDSEGNLIALYQTA